MRPTADLVTFTEEILDRKLHFFLCSDITNHLSHVNHLSHYACAIDAGQFSILYYDKKNWSEHLLLYLEQRQKQWLSKASQKYGDVMLIVILFLINLVWQQPTQMLKKLSASGEVVRSIFWYDLQKF